MFVSLAIALQVTAITNVTVIDPATGRQQQGQTIVVRGTRIAQVAPARSARVPEGAAIVEGRGRFVIPGLWDMHVHNDVPGGRALLSLYPAHGVTGVRDMDGRLDVLRDWQRGVAAGEIAGPRMVVSGPYLAGQPVPLPHLLVRTPESAITSVDSLVRLGVDFIKVHNGMTPASFFAAARQARARRAVFAGHVFPPVTPRQAADSGQRSLEHLSGFPNRCTPADSVRLSAAHPLHRLLFGACTSVPQEGDYRHLASRTTWVTPTLVVQTPVADFRMPVTPGDSISRFYSDSLMAMLTEIMPLPQDRPEAEKVLGRNLYGRRAEIVKALVNAGVPILAGTDAPIAPTLPGDALHEELALLVRAGLTPLQALRSATSEPARYLAAADSLGSVRVGHLADLVVLDANPLQQIANTRRIHAVVANGRLYTRAALDALIEGARVRR